MSFILYVCFCIKIYENIGNREIDLQGGDIFVVVPTTFIDLFKIWVQKKKTFFHKNIGSRDTECTCD